ncbi:MAG: hypothetical protein IJT95_05790 [Abditibacteriota bacterium]|nr:hypothetical protein [Abditibacteriota bacterium]
MDKLNNPKAFVVLLVIAVAALLFSATRFKKQNEPKDSIYIDDREAEKMIKSFQDGSAYESGAAGPTAPDPEKR